jgi:hypothetical protein
MAETKPLVAPASFQDRYAVDASFRKAVDARRTSAQRTRTTTAIKDALAMIRGVPGATPKHY